MIQSTIILCLALSNWSNCTRNQVWHITTAEYSHRNCTTKIDYAAHAAEFKENSQIYI